MKLIRKIFNRNSRFFFIGHSHVVSLVNACEGKNINQHDSNLAVDYLRIGASNQIDYFAGKISPRKFTSEIEARLKQLGKDCKVVTAYGGNSYLQIGLVKPKTPFDFVMKADEIDSLVSEFLVPSAMVEQQLVNSFGFPETLDCLSATRSVFAGEIYQISSPPPIKDSEFLLKHAGPFADLFKERGVNDPYARHRLWRLQESIIEKKCTELNIGYVPVPNHMLDEGKFLNARYFGGDTNHANSEFGLNLLDAKFGGFK